MEHRIYLLIICELETRHRAWMNLLAPLEDHTKLGFAKQQELLAVMITIWLSLLSRDDIDASLIHPLDQLIGSLIQAIKKNSDWRPDAAGVEVMRTCGDLAHFQNYLQTPVNFMGQYGKVHALITLFHATANNSKLMRVLDFLGDSAEITLRKPSESELTAYGRYVKNHRFEAQPDLQVYKRSQEKYEGDDPNLDLSTGGQGLDLHATSVREKPEVKKGAAAVKRAAAVSGPSADDLFRNRGGVNAKRRNELLDALLRY